MRTRFCCSVCFPFFLTKHFKRFILRCSGECKIACILYHFTSLDEIVDLIFKLIFVLGNVARKNNIHLGRKATVLTGMCFIYKDRKVIVLINIADVFKNELELVNNCDDDLYAVIKQIFQLSGTFCPAYRRGYLCELLYGIFYLLIEVDSVGDNDNRIEYLFTIVGFQSDKLMCEPRYGIGLS